jgi:hypothetical protein
MRMKTWASESEFSTIFGWIKTFRSSQPIPIILDTNHSLVKGIQISIVKGQVLFRGEI